MHNVNFSWTCKIFKNGSNRYCYAISLSATKQRDNNIMFGSVHLFVCLLAHMSELSMLNSKKTTTLQFETNMTITSTSFRYLCNSCGKGSPLSYTRQKKKKHLACSTWSFGKKIGQCSSLLPLGSCTIPHCTPTALQAWTPSGNFKICKYTSEEFFYECRFNCSGNDNRQTGGHKDAVTHITPLLYTW